MNYVLIPADKAANNVNCSCLTILLINTFKLPC